MARTVLTFGLACTLNFVTITAQSTHTGVLTTVRITTRVMAGGTPLPSATYEVLTQEGPTPLAGQSPEAQRWVEFVADGKVIAREIAEVLQVLPSPATEFTVAA